MRWGLLCVAALVVVSADADAKRRKRGKTTKTKTVKVKEDPKPAEAKSDPVTNGETVAPAAAPAKKMSVAVLELASLGIPSDEIQSLERYLRNSIATIDSVELISPVDVQIALRKPKNKSVAECGGGPKCAVEVGKLVQAGVVVFGSVGAMGDAFSLNLRAMDVTTGKELARKRTSLAGTRHQLIPEMRLAAYGLIAPDRIRGSLLIEIDVEGVEVEIDGEIVGLTPLKEEVKNLKPGPHLVVLRRKGYSQFQQEFEIKPFDTARLKLDLKKATAAAPAPAQNGGAEKK